MVRNVWGIVSGLVVLALGVVAVTGLIRSEKAPVEATPMAATTTASPLLGAMPVEGSPPVSIGPELPGVSSRVSSVLAWNGDTGFAGDEELAQLPSTVAALLTHYGVPLRVPMAGDDR